MRTSIIILVCVAGLLTACVRAPLTPVTPELPRGEERRASFSLPESADSAWFEVFVPDATTRVRAVVAFIDRGLDRYAFDDRDWRAMCARSGCALVRLGLPRQDDRPVEQVMQRNAKLGGGAALLEALTLAAGLTGHAELGSANIVVFGFSAAGTFGPTFAALYPDRTVGFIRYHSNSRGLALDTTALSRVPALFIAGAIDSAAGSEDSKALSAALRARGGPSAFVSHIGQSHQSVDGLIAAGPLMRDWVETLLRQRLQAGSGKPAPVNESTGWVVHDSTFEIAPASERPRMEGSWLPDRRTAFALRDLSGPCSPIGVSTATELLGAGVRRDAEEVDADFAVCHYVSAEPRRDLWISSYRQESDSAAAKEVVRARVAAKGSAVPGLGEAAFFSAGPGCSSLGAAVASRVIMLSLCGPGFAVPGDSARLIPLVRKLIGK